MSPSIAIIDANTLATIGLKSILQDIMPIAQVEVFGSFAELQSNNPEQYFHYFVAMNIGLEYDRHNFLLMHAMGPNVAGVIGSAVAAGALLGFLS